MGVVSGIPARIPSRLGEPGSLFSRYKFLQLRLVVVMLLTRTRRELLKRRTIGARIYPAASLSRASRATPFVTAADPRYIPTSRRLMRFFSFINLATFPLAPKLHLKNKQYSRCSCDLHSSFRFRPLANIASLCLLQRHFFFVYIFIWGTKF